MKCMNSLKESWGRMDKILNFLGIARRAGKLSLGSDAVEESVNRKKSRLIIVACDVSERIRKSVEKISEKGNVKTVFSDISMEEIGNSIGKAVGIISVNDEGFAKRFIELFA